MRSPVLCLASLLMCALATTPSIAAPAMWEVRDDDSALWLFGSFHVLPESVEWRTPLFDNTLAQADTVVFEADVRPAAMMAIGAEAFARGIYTDGRLLTDSINSETENKLRKVAADLGLPVGSLLAMRPWFAALTITTGATSAIGYTSEGVEYILQPELPSEKQVYLETAAEQLDVLAVAPDEEQFALFEATLNEVDGMAKVLDKMVSNWAEGTPERLANLFVAETGAYSGAFVERLIYARNRNWLPKFETMLAENNEALVIVGAGHLIGEDSVINLLEEAGYHVARIQ
jgi:uncharacterized protein YbaP (TraB family)